MEDTKDAIAHMIQNMCFERKSRASAQQKAAYAALEAGTGKTAQALNKLHLRLWHAVSHGDYHSLSLDETKRLLEAVRQDIDALLKENFS